MIKYLSYSKLYILTAIILISETILIQKTCAENISVTKFSETNEIMTETNGRKDLNGNFCALIKVFTPEDNAAFEGNIIGTIEYKINEYSVFLSPGTKYLKVKYKSCPSLTIDIIQYLGKAVESKRIYSLELKVPMPSHSISPTDLSKSEQLVFGKQLAANGDSVAAEKWFKMAAENGSSEAMCILGDLLKTKIRPQTRAVRTLKKDSALIWYLRSAESGYPEGMYKAAGRMNWKNYTDTAQIRAMLQKAAMSGYAPAFEKLGDYYATRTLSNTSNHLVTDISLAEHWYRQGLKYDKPNNSYKLGNLYRTYYTPAAEASYKAFSAWNDAAAENHPDAMKEIGECYLNGYGVKKDEKKGIQLLTESIRLGCNDPKLLQSMARRFFYGDGVKKNLDKAYEICTRLTTDSKNSAHFFETAKLMIEIEKSMPDINDGKSTVRGIVIQPNDIKINLTGTGNACLYDDKVTLFNLSKNDHITFSAPSYDDYNLIYDGSINELLVELKKKKYDAGGLTAGETVDMGGSVLWSTRNLGAADDHHAGRLFTYPMPIDDNGNDISDKIKNGQHEPLHISGTSLDPVTAELGEGWRLPTPEEVKELIEYCNWEWEEDVMGSGMRITSPINGNNIFLPAVMSPENSGTTIYNTGIMSVPQAGPYSFYFNAKSKTAGISQHWYFYNYALRPVKEKSAKSDSEFCRFSIKPFIKGAKSSYSGIFTNIYIDNNKVGDFVNGINGAEIIISKGKHTLAFGSFDSNSPKSGWPKYEIDTDKSVFFNETITIPD